MQGGSSRKGTFFMGFHYIVVVYGRVGKPVISVCKRTFNPRQKSLGQYCDIHIFLSFVGSLLKQCILFEIFFHSWKHSCSTAIEKQDTFFGYFRCQALKIKTLIYIRDWKKETELRVCLYVRAVTRTQITRDSADQDIVHMKENRSEKKRVDLFMRA